MPDKHTPAATSPAPPLPQIQVQQLAVFKFEAVKIDYTQPTQGIAGIPDDSRVIQIQVVVPAGVLHERPGVLDLHGNPPDPLAGNIAKKPVVEMVFQQAALSPTTLRNMIDAQEQQAQTPTLPPGQAPAPPTIVPPAGDSESDTPPSAG